VTRASGGGKGGLKHTLEKVTAYTTRDVMVPLRDPSGPSTTTRRKSIITKKEGFPEEIEKMGRPGI